MREPAVTALLINDDGLYLGVSRKYDHTKFGLVGGKIDTTDPSPELALIREVREECGLDVYDIQLVFETVWKDRHQRTYTAKWKGCIHTDEPHIVKWLTKQELIDGPFGEYNKLLFETLGL